MALNGAIPKYLFAVRYRDGSEYHATPDDKPRIAKLPPGVGSCWSDVRPDEVEQLALLGPGLEAIVDLRTGLFSVNGVDLMPNQTPPHHDVARLRPIFFRRQEEFLTVNLATDSLVGKTTRTRYCIGWQTTATDRKNQTEILGFF